MEITFFTFRAAVSHTTRARWPVTATTLHTNKGLMTVLMSASYLPRIRPWETGLLYQRKDV